MEKSEIIGMVGGCCIVAVRGRYKDGKTVQQMEPNTEGLCNTLTTVSKDNMVLIRQATKEGYTECEPDGIADLSYPNSKTRRGRVIEKGNITPTITTSPSELCSVHTIYRIRRLTPRECGRYMAVTEADIDKMYAVNSETQLYKQYGNSIVVKCLEAVFRNLNIAGVKNWEEFSREEGSHGKEE